MTLPALAAEASDTRVEVLGVLTTPTPGATVAIDLTTGAFAYKWTASEAETVNASGTQMKGQMITCIITNDAGSARTITFGTGFKASDTIVGTQSKTATISFRSDGTNLWETCRCLAIS